MRYLEESAIAPLGLGAALLGGGGGGDTYVMSLVASRAIREYGSIPLIAPHELDDDALIIALALMGSPIIMEEKLPGWDPLRAPLERLERHLGRRADAVMPCLAGGLNCISAIASAAAVRRPMVDADGAGRAVSELSMITRPLKGASEVLKPNHFEVANAVGAAIAQISGEVDRVFSLEKISRDGALDQAKQEAKGRAIAAGARPESVQIVDVEDVPLAYLPSNATRIRVKTVGDLNLQEGVV